MRPDPLQWWQTRRFVALAALLAALPLLWPDIPPLVDLPGHMARYRVQLSQGQVPWFADWYDFRWSLIGNLGVDLLVEPLAPILGLELAVKLIILLIPPMTVAGLLWIAREVHGRIPPTALFALPLAYSYPFHFGFVNFALSMAFALLAFALWLRLARLGKLKLRAILFVPIGAVVWVTHTFGWGTLGLLCFSAELIRQHDLKTGWVRPWFLAALHCLPLAPPALLMVAWRSGAVEGETGDWFNWQAKAGWLAMVLRDRWMAWDIAGAAVLALLLFAAARRRGMRFVRELAVPALFLLAAFIVIPRIALGSAFADMRLAPYLLAIAVVAIRVDDRTKTVALIGLAFFTARAAGTAASLGIEHRAYSRELAALNHVPIGAPLVTLVAERCGDSWAHPRMRHLPSLALVRRLAFANDQWRMAGAQLLSVRMRGAGAFAADPSQIVYPAGCPLGQNDVAAAVARIDRSTFSHIWLIGLAHPQPTPPDLERIWSNGASSLYRTRAYRRLSGGFAPH